MKLDFTESATVEFKETLPASGINKPEHLEPPLEQTDSLFIITLPNLHEVRAESHLPAQVIEEKAAALELTPDEIAILDLYKAEGRDYITRLDVENALDITNTPAKQRLRGLVKKGVLRIVGRSSSTKYYLGSAHETEVRPAIKS